MPKKISPDDRRLRCKAEFIRDGITMLCVRPAKLYRVEHGGRVLREGPLCPNHLRVWEKLSGVTITQLDVRKRRLN